MWFTLDWPAWLVGGLVVVLIAVTNKVLAGLWRFLALLGIAAFLLFGVAWNIWSVLLWISAIALVVALVVRLIYFFGASFGKTTSDRLLQGALSLLIACFVWQFVLVPLWHWATTSWPLWAWVTAVVVACLVAIAFVLGRAFIRYAWWFVAVAVLAVVALLMGTFSYGFGHGGTSQEEQSDDQTEQTDDTVEPLDPALIEMLTVSTISDSARCETNDFGIVEPDIAALKGIPPRATADAISTPFKATKPADILSEAQVSICEDALYGSTVGVFFANDIADTFQKYGVDLVEVNPWLAEFVDADIATVADSYVLTEDEAKDATDEEISAALTKNREWQDQAARLNTMLERYEMLGIQELDSSVTYHITAPVVGGLPSVGPDDKVDSLPALVFSFTQKNGCSVSEFGLNLQDKRPELFTPDCSTPNPETTPPTTNTTPPTTPGCTTNCSTTPPTTPPTTCQDKEKPNDPEHTYTPVRNAKGCIISWKQTGSSLNDGPQHQDVQTDRGNQEQAQEQSPNTPTTPPAQNPVVPLPDTDDPEVIESAAPDPTPGGYDGGSTSQPGASGTPDPGPSQPAVDRDDGGF